MKNLLKISFAFVLFTILFASCTKDQKCINQLDRGKWEVSELKINNVVDTSGQSVNATTTWDFTKYKSKEAGTEGDFVATYTDVDTSYTVDYHYKIEEDCSKFWFNLHGDPDSLATTATITEHSSSKLLLSWSIDFFGTAVPIELTIKK